MRYQRYQWRRENESQALNWQRSCRWFLAVVGVLLFAASAARADERQDLRVASFNVENLFAYRGARWQAQEDQRVGNRGANWLPKSREEYRLKVKQLARTVVQSLASPDIIALQEIENITRVRGDDRVDVLKDLTREIKRVGKQLGQPVKYRFAKAPGASDERGIGQVFLYRTDRVRLAKVSSTDPLLGAQLCMAQPTPSANPRPLNGANPQLTAADGLGPEIFSRPVIAGLFEAYRDGLDRGPSKRLYVLNNHFKSNPSSCQVRRWNQANFNAQLLRTVLDKDPQANVLVVGDFNLDHFQEAHRQQAAPLENAPCDAQGQARWCNLNYKMQGPRFTYIYKGKPEQLDWMIASSQLSSTLRDVRAVHLKAAAPSSTQLAGSEMNVPPLSEQSSTPAPRSARLSDHDPVVARFSFDPASALSARAR